MTVSEALSFVRKHGVVLVSAKGPVPRLTDAIAGEPVCGNWWGHPKGKLIFNTLEAVVDSPDILVCRLIGDKATLVHRRLWPALARLSKRFTPRQLTQVRQEHTSSGRHVNRETPYPKWAPAEALEKANKISEAEAIAALGPWADSPARKRRLT